MLQITCKLVNIIFNSGIFPEIWGKGVILPLYKNKGNINDPDNYRGITFFSCFGKLFTTILNKRFNSFLESNNIFAKNKQGLGRNNV